MKITDYEKVQALAASNIFCLTDLTEQRPSQQML